MAGSHDHEPTQEEAAPQGTVFAAGDERAPGGEKPTQELDLDLDLPREVASRLERLARASGEDQLPEGEAELQSKEDGPPPEGERQPAETSAQLQELQAEADKLRGDVEAYKEKWLRAMAELENFRKRMRRELESSILLANAKVLREELEVLDNLERAVAAVPTVEGGAGDTLAQGVRLILDRFREILRQNGVVRIEAENVPFDPNLHEAISQVERPDVPSHQIVEVAQAGYMLGDLVLRPARVVVAK